MGSEISPSMLHIFHDKMTMSSTKVYKIRCEHGTHGTEDNVKVD